MEEMKCEYCGTPMERREINILGTVLESFVMKCDCWKKEKEKREREDRKREVRDAIQALVQNSGVGKRYAKAEFKSFRQIDKNADMFLVCVRFLKTFSQNKAGKGLFLYGGLGCGKTHLAVSLAKGLLRKGYTVDFYKMPRLFDEYKATFSYRSEEDTETFLKGLERVDLLILDDLGVDKFTLEFNLFLYKILDARYNNMKPVVITSNIPFDKIESVIERRTADRLRAMCKAVENKAGSYRQVEAKE